MKSQCPQCKVFLEKPIHNSPGHLCFKYFANSTKRKSNKSDNPKCSECGKIFTADKTLAKHMKYAHNGKPFSCDKCDFKTNTGSKI